MWMWKLFTKLCMFCLRKQNIIQPPKIDRSALSKVIVFNKLMEK